MKIPDELEPLVQEQIRLTEWRRTIGRGRPRPNDLLLAEKRFAQAIEDAVPENLVAATVINAYEINKWLDFKETDRFTLEARMLAPIHHHLRTIIVTEANRRENI